MDQSFFHNIVWSRFIRLSYSFAAESAFIFEK